MTVAKPVRILHITSGLGTGGAEGILRDLAAYLEEHDIEQRIISFGGPEESRIPVGIDESKILFLNLRKRPRAIFSMLWRLHQEIQNFEPSLVHTWMYHADLIGGFIAKLQRCPVVWGIFSGNLDSRFYRRSTRLVIRLCGILAQGIPNRILSVSQRGIDVHKKIGYPLKKIILVPVGFDTRRFRPSKTSRKRFREKYQLSPNQPVVGMVARYDPQKDFDTFFFSIDSARRHLPELHAVIVGGYGVSQKNGFIQRKLIELDLEQAISVLGFVGSIEEFYNGIDLFVLASHGEGFPKVIGEAMASGVPSISTDVGDARTIIGDAGQVISCGNSAELSAGIVSFFNQRTEQCASICERARKRIQENYELKCINKRYLQIYKEILSLTT